MNSKIKNALVCGGGGFIGNHLVNYLKQRGYWVRAVDIKHPEFCETKADQFLILDLRQAANCKKALTINDIGKSEFDEVYQLAADMGGMGFIQNAECEIYYNNTLINLNMMDQSASLGVEKYFFSSSACVYRNMGANEEFIGEEHAYPAMPDNEYGWEKLYAERVALTYGRKYNTKIRIGRFQNCYGPYGTWEGGREKAPAALCRKIAEAKDNDTVEIWGDGSAFRSYVFVTDLVRAIHQLTLSNLAQPTNIGVDHLISVKDLALLIAKVANKKINIMHIDGPVGVSSRNHKFEKINSLGWKAEIDLESGIKLLYPWIEQQVKASIAST